MKRLIAATFLLALALPASAQFVNFVNSPGTVSLTTTVTVDETPVFNESRDLSSTADAVFSGNIPTGLTVGEDPLVLPFSLSIVDDDRATTDSLTYQASFSVTNPVASVIPISANSLVFNVSGLVALNPGQVLTGAFNFVSGDTSLTDNFTSSYNANTETFTFASTNAFALPANSTLNFTGTFVTSAIPEPSSFAALFGLAAVGLAASRRRPRAAN